MSVNAIRQILQRLNISCKGIGGLNHYSTCTSQTSTKIQNFILPSLTIKSAKFSPNFDLSASNTIPLNVDLPAQSEWISPIIVDNPLIKPDITIELPKLNIIPISEKISENSMELPAIIKIEKQAARLIMIRRRKMRKHKRRKLRKRMTYVWRKIKQKRELQRERGFQAELLGQIKEAETFNAKTYVDSRLQILDHVRLPNKWRGELLPEHMIKQFLKEKQERLNKKLNRPRLTLD